MTVEELISELEQFDPNMEVKFAYNYGDYWRTQVAANINNVEEGQVNYSSYHNMDRVSVEEHDDERIVVILS